MTSSEGIIEECESPYASPVVLIPKPNGTFRLCIDYRKLNEIDRRDTYPLPRMDDLLHQAKTHPLFMLHPDLRAGYHQVKVRALKIKTRQHLYVHFLALYRFLRMPYGCATHLLRSRLMNRFCNGLEDILALPYLDDIIVLSETFEKHMFDLKTIFERLLHLLYFKYKSKLHTSLFTQSNPVERKTETLNPDLQYLLETIILVGIPNSSHTFCHEYNCL
ncbi:hypothetical protein TNCV_1042311 [Trichonephila clavipes]|nr:hypothetical protein TNCV_1042311 [Trichonephila clavipes]